MKHAMSWELEEQNWRQVENKGRIFCDFQLLNHSLSVLEQDLPKKPKECLEKAFMN